MIYIDPLYLLLNMVLLGTFAICGINITHGENYWKNAFWCIIVFTLILGARYMRGNDYEHYLDVYDFDMESDEKLYSLLCRCLNFLGVNHFMQFFIYALIFSSALMVFLYRFNQYACWLFPLSIVAFIFFHEYMIRQELSYAFVFLYLDRLFSVRIFIRNHKLIIPRSVIKNITYCIVFAVCTASIHSGNIPVLMLFTLFYFLYSRPISWKISIPVILISTYVLNRLYDLSSLNSALELIAGTNEKMSSYANRFDFWFGADAAKDEYTRKWYILIWEMAGHCSLFYLGWKMLKNTVTNKSIATIFNCYVFGAVFINLFRELEILNRIGYVFNMWWFVPVGLLIAKFNNLNLHKWEKCLYAFLTFFFYDYLRYLLLRQDMTMFLWDMI